METRGAKHQELRLLTKEQMGEIYETYMVRDFPRAELPPLWMLMERMDRGIYDCLGLYEEGELKAYGNLVKNRETGFLLLDFLAVCAGNRGGGYGSRFLSLLRDYYGEEQGVLLECESERSAEDEESRRVRRRRIHFYQKNGCQVTRTKVVLFGVEFDILFLPLQARQCQADQEMDGIYRLILGEERRRKHVTIWNRNRRMLGSMAWDREAAGLRDAQSLLAALGFADGRKLPRIVSLAGAGGKTATMYQLADELAEQGLRVLVTTSTHIRRPERGAVAEIAHVSELNEGSWNGLILTAGRPAEQPGKLAMPEGLGEETELARLLELADVILIEADGAKEHPLKVPAAHEPVILPQTGLVIACAGLRALGMPMGQACFRLETDGGWLRRGPEDPAGTEDLALILMDERGSHKQVEGRYYRVVLNQADQEADRLAAAEVLAQLPFAMQEHAAVTWYDTPEAGEPGYYFVQELLAGGCVYGETVLEGPEAGTKRVWRTAPQVPGFPADQELPCVCCRDGVRVHAERLAQEPELVICGGGHISLELSRLADFMEYDHTVMDDRAEFSGRDRFPGAKACLCGDMPQLLKMGQFSSNASYIIVTRGHAADLACLEQVLRKPHGYVGMIGSRSKVARVMEALEKQGFSQEVLAEVHAPIGLPIGGQTPKEIAVSILAQLIQVRNQEHPASCLGAEVEQFLSAGKAGVMVTIIGKQGSAPRGVGCRMAVGPRGEQAGTIGGGQVEAQAKADALAFWNDPGRERLRTGRYEVNMEAAASLGMWCGGSLEIMFERMDGKE